MKQGNQNIIPNIKTQIFTIRGFQVMLDRDLAKLYGVETRALNQAVKRNKERFPNDFVFQLTKAELKDWVSQIVISNKEVMGIRNMPFAFTEQGVATLSGILRSKKAIEMNIQIMRAFVSMRRFLSQNAGLFQRVENVEQKLLTHDKNFDEIFSAIEEKTITPRQGIFFDGQVFDAYKFVCDLVKSAKTSITLIDNYIDESVLTLFSKAKKGVEIKILSSRITKQLKLDIKKFNSQYNNIKLIRFSKSHDRFLVIDDKVYHFGASLKDLGKKWFAFSKIELDKKVLF